MSDLLTLTGITKSFGGVRAHKGVDFSLAWVQSSLSPCCFSMALVGSNAEWWWGGIPYVTWADPRD
jgi:hypothetical protein